LCNGTRLIFNSVISNKVFYCTIVESQAEVLIPRITFVPLSDDSWPIDWQRKQFPLKAAFVMTINKAQGQTMQMAGLFLRPKVFTLGQLYVAKGQNAKSLRGKQDKRVQRNEEDSAKRYSYS
jgi:ATP-dependent DNA helicase PIF1